MGRRHDELRMHWCMPYERSESLRERDRKLDAEAVEVEAGSKLDYGGGGGKGV